MNAKCVMVTGGAGFIGGHLVGHLLQAGFDVINVDNLSYASRAQTLVELDQVARTIAAASPRPPVVHRFIQGDINDTALMSQLLDQFTPAAVLHLAAESHVDRSIQHAPLFVQSNVMGTASLLEACLRYWQKLGQHRERFAYLQVSTDEVYGSIDDPKYANEQQPLNPTSPYAASKAAADHWVQAYFKTYGLPVQITRCVNNYGPRQFPEKLIPLMITRASVGQTLPLYGDGQHMRHWLHVDDHCRALLAILQEGRVGEIYNISGRTALPNQVVVEQICDEVDRQATALRAGVGRESPRPPSRQWITTVADRWGHDRRYAIDDNKLRSTTSWCEQMEFSEGLRQTIAWYLQEAIR